jgi:phage FluMu protein gp41
MKTITVKLEDPIEVAGKKTAEITIRKPVVKDLKAAAGAGSSELERSLRMIGDLSGLSPEDMNELSLVDMVKINGELIKANFIPSGQTLPSN